MNYKSLINFLYLCLHIENRNMKSSDFNSVVLTADDWETLQNHFNFKFCVRNLAFWIIFSPVNRKGWFKLQTMPRANNGWIHGAPDSGWQDQKRKKKRLDRPYLQQLQSYFTQLRFIHNQIKDKQEGPRRSGTFSKWSVQNEIDSHVWAGESKRRIFENFSKNLSYPRLCYVRLYFITNEGVNKVFVVENANLKRAQRWTSKEWFF